MSVLAGVVALADRSRGANLMKYHPWAMIAVLMAAWVTTEAAAAAPDGASTPGPPVAARGGSDPAAQVGPRPPAPTPQRLLSHRPTAPPSLFGEDEEGNLGFAGPQLPANFGASYLVRRTVIVSLLLIVASAASLWLGYRRRGSTGQRDGAASPLQILQTLTVAPRCALHLVQVEGHKFLVASDSSGWKSVTAVDSFATTFEAVEPTTAAPIARPTFSELPRDSFPSRIDPWQEFKLNR